MVYTEGCCFMDVIDGRFELVSGVGVYWAPVHPKRVSKCLNIEQPSQNKSELINSTHTRYPECLWNGYYNVGY